MLENGTINKVAISCEIATRLGVKNMQQVYIFWLIGVLASSSYADVLLVEDHIEEVLLLQSKYISTISAKFQVTRMSGRKQKIDLKMDIPGDKINATVVYEDLHVEDMPAIRKWVKNDKQEWSAIPEYAVEQEGTWLVTTAKVNELSVPRGLNRGEFMVDDIQKIFKPYHLRGLENITKEMIPDNLKVSVQKQVQGDRSIRTYQFYVDGNKLREVIYEYGITEGMVLIFKSTEYLYADGNKRMNFQGEYSDYNSS